MDRNLFLVLDVVDRLGNLARTGMRRIGATHNLQPVHFQALMFLRQANLYSNTPQALTDYLGLTKGTVSQSLQLLYRKGLIKRYADEKDKRVVRLELSPVGEKLLKDFRSIPEWSPGQINPARIKTTLSSLREMVMNLQVSAGGRTFGSCHTCRHYQREGQRTYRCGLTGERLIVAETRKICRLHALKE